jgi:hypothetical protein
MYGKFELIFLSVVLLTIMCGCAAGLFAVLEPSTASPLATRFFDASLQAFVLGMGAVFGLLGGHSFQEKPKRPDRER